MLYTPEAVFIHVPKTGGMSVTRFLVNALDTPVWVFAAERAGRNHTPKLPETPGAAAKLHAVTGRRHASCPTAAEEIRAAGLDLPPVAFSIVREPVALMVSYYKYMHMPKVWKQRGMEPGNLTGAPRLAVEGTFDDFVRRADFYGMDDARLARYYRPAAFERLDIVALEHLDDYLRHRFGHHRAFDGARMDRRNSSGQVEVEVEFGPGTEAAIAAKYPRLAETYRTALKRDWARS